MADQVDPPTEPTLLANPAIAAAVEASNPPTNASTPASMDPAHDDDIHSKKVHLADLSAKGTTLYAHKNFEEAAEVFSRASVLQAEINGETAPENAEILFHYGRSLYKVGLSKSDVLGAGAPEKKKKANGKKPAAKTQQQKVTVPVAAEGKEGDKTTADVKVTASEPSANKPLFQFTGDENFDDSDEDEVRAAQQISRYLLTLLPGTRGRG